MSIPQAESGERRWVQTGQVMATSPYCGGHERATELGVSCTQVQVHVRAGATWGAAVGCERHSGLGRQRGRGRIRMMTCWSSGEESVTHVQTAVGFWACAVNTRADAGDGGAAAVL